MLDEIEAAELVSRLWSDFADNRERSKEWQRWALGRQELPAVPSSATAEYKGLQEKAITPWLGLIVQSLAQALIVEGYRQTGAVDDQLLWSVWQANRMDANQVGVYEAALTTGVSYLAVLPTDTPRSRSTPMVDGTLPVPEWRPYSSASMTAFYESPYDEWPAYAIAAEPAPKWRERENGESESVWRVTLLDESAVYIVDLRSGVPVVRDIREHSCKVTPVVRFTNRQTITGRALGEVEPYVAVASRIDQDVFDRLVVQRFGSWNVRWATGLVMPGSPEEQAQQDLALKMSDILVSDSEATKFGSLPATQMDGHLRAPLEDVRMLAAVSQTPPTVLTGDLSNISAEALAAIESAYNRKVEQRKVTFGEAWEQAFGLSARLMDQEVDIAAQVQWRDMESRSLAQTADALGKIADQLEIPVEVLWDKIGFLTEQDRQRARDLRAAAASNGMDALLRELTAGQIPPELPAA